MRVFAFGDVHGRPNTLKHLLARAGVKSGDCVVGLGDYLDRGPNSKGALELLCEMRKDYDLRCVVGNHDGFWASAFGFPHKLPENMLCYGIDRFNCVPSELFGSDAKRSTLSSYGLSLANIDLNDWSAFPAAHRDFLSSLKPYELLNIENHNFIFVHAGLPKVAMALSSVEEALDWTIRNRPSQLMFETGSITIEPNFKATTIVHGHIPWALVDELANGKKHSRVPRPVSFRLPGRNFAQINLDASSDLDRIPRLAGMWFPDMQIVTVEGDD